MFCLLPSLSPYQCRLCTSALKTMKARALSVNHLSRSAWHRAWTTVSLGVFGEWITIGKPCSLLAVPGNDPNAWLLCQSVWSL